MLSVTQSPLGNAGGTKRQISKVFVGADLWNTSGLVFQCFQLEVETASCGKQCISTRSLYSDQLHSRQVPHGSNIWVPSLTPHFSPLCFGTWSASSPVLPDSTVP